MSDTPESQAAENRRKGWGFYVVVILLLLVLYPLSYGPLCWLYWNGYIGETAGRFIWPLYAPMVWAAHHSQSADDALNWYVGWWHHRL